MKKCYQVWVFLFCVIIFNQKSFSQITYNAGFELGFSLENGYGSIYGISVGAEHSLGKEKMGVTVQTGLLIAPADLGNTFSDVFSSLIPIQAGYKYYLNSKERGIYIHAQIGVHMQLLRYKYTYEKPLGIDQNGSFITGTYEDSGSDTPTNFSYALGAGYLISEKIDLGTRYNVITAFGGNFSYFGLRAAYNF
jgi:hypothetical protein